MKKRVRAQKRKKKEEEKPLKERQEEDENELGRKSFEVEFRLKKIGPVEQEESRKGIKAEGVSGKEVDQITQGKGQDCARDRWKRKPEKEGEDEHEVRPDALDGKELQKGGLKGEDKNSKKDEEEEPFLRSKERLNR
jgi:hypothetical protein